MVQIVRVRDGYEFVGLSSIGMRLVNEFQRRYPLLCKPTQIPNYRFIHFGSAEENLKLGELIAEVRTSEEPRKTLWSKKA